MDPYGSICGDTFWSKKHEVAQQNTHQYRALGLPPYGSMCGRVLEASSGTPFTTLAHRLDHHGLALGLPPYGRMHGRVSREMCEVRLR